MYQGRVLDDSKTVAECRTPYTDIYPGNFVHVLAEEQSRLTQQTSDSQEDLAPIVVVAKVYQQVVVAEPRVNPSPGEDLCSSIIAGICLGFCCGPVALFCVRVM